MLHPLVDDLSELKDSEVEEKLQELNKKYFTASRLGNNQVLTQLSTLVTIYREELQKRYLAQKIALQENDGEDLDNLINVD